MKTIESPMYVVWAWALAFAACLWMLDFPKPMVDDLYYCGAGMNMALGGDFSNPFLGRVYYPSHYFFAYPPLHSYAIFGWLKCLHLSAASLTGFVAVMYLLAACSTIALLRRYGGPSWLEWLVPVGVCAGLLPAGLRPEPFAVALIMTGFAVCECGKGGVASTFVGSLSLFLGGSAAPRMTPFGAVLVLYVVFRLWRDPEVKSSRWACYAAMAVALAASVFALLLMIHFRVSEFWQTFHYNTVKLVGGSKLTLFKGYWRDFIITEWGWPLLLLMLVFFVLALRRPVARPSIVAIFIICGFALSGAVGGLTYGAFWWIAFILFLVAGKVMAGSNRFISGLVAVLILGAFLIPYRKVAIETFGIWTGNVSLAATGDRTAARALKPDPEHALLVDQFTARYVYDYRTPEGTLDWGTATLFPSGKYIDTRLWKSGDTFVLAPPNIHILERFTLLDTPPQELWAPSFLPHMTVYKHPRFTSVIPVEKCRGVRPEFIPPNSPNPLEWTSKSQSAPEKSGAKNGQIERNGA